MSEVLKPSDGNKEKRSPKIADDALTQFVGGYATEFARQMIESGGTLRIPLSDGTYLDVKKEKSDDVESEE